MAQFSQAALPRLFSESDAGKESPLNSALPFSSRPSMSYARLDGLWHCLCPSFRQTLFTPSRHLVQALNTANQYRGYAQDAQKHTPRNAQILDTRLDRGLRSNSFRPPPRRRLKPRTGPQPPSVDVKSELSTEAAYERLRLAARRGEYARVKDFIALLVGKRGEKPSVQLYHAMISVNADPQYGSPHEVVSLLQEMIEEGLYPDSAIYHAVLKVLSVHPDYILRQRMLHELHERWFTITEDGWHDVIVGLIRDRQLEVAMVNLENIERQGIKVCPWLYDILVYNLCELSEFDEALRVMQRRFFSGEAPISLTLWHHFLDSASRSLHYDSVAFVWRNRVELGYLNLSCGICINVLNTAARKGDTKLATAVFHTLQSRNHTFDIHHYEALLESWLASDDLKAALTILSVMLQARLPPTEASTRAIFGYLCDDYGRPTEALQILRRLQEEDRPIPHAAFNVVLEAFIRFNDLGSALESYKTMHLIIPKGPDTSTFNTLLRGCRHTNRFDLAMFFASEMTALNIPPNALTYDRLILACLAERDTADRGFGNAWKYYEEMRQMGWSLRAGTLRFLGRTGCEVEDERIFELVQEGSFTPERMHTVMHWHWGKKTKGGGQDKQRTTEEATEEDVEADEE